LFFLSNSLPLLHYANTWYQYPSFVRLDLDTHDHYTHRQKRFGDMEPNMKILIENLMKQVRDEIKQSWDDITAGFAAHVNTVDKRFTELSTDMKKRDDHISVLETVAASLDISIAEWKPQVEESFHSVCLELSKVNSYFNRDAKESTITKSRVLSIESVPHHPLPGVVAADGPRGHCVEHWNRDCGFGSIYTHTHIPDRGTMQSPTLNFSPHQFASSVARDFSHTNASDGLNNKLATGRLPKIYFPNFEGDNPRLWQSRCENYFEMHDVDLVVWVKVAVMHFEGPTARWLQSMDHRGRFVSWIELCSWIHERFSDDQHVRNQVVSTLV
jgi:hypothetical protein